MTGPGDEKNYGERAGWLAVCRGRATAYLDAGDLGRAHASLISDLSKSEATRDLADMDFLEAVTTAVLEDDVAGLRALIESLA